MPKPVKRAKAAKRSQPSPRALANVRVDPQAGRGDLRPFGGAQHDDWNERLVVQLATALPQSEGSGTVVAVERAAGAVAGQVGINPRDTVEGMIGAQLIAAHEAALELYRRAWISEQSFEVRIKFLALADKAARTVAMLSEALYRHRGKGQQQITVKHVTVNAEQLPHPS